MVEEERSFVQNAVSAIHAFTARVYRCGDTVANNVAIWLFPVCMAYHNEWKDINSICATITSRDSQAVWKLVVMRCLIKR